MKQDKIIFGEAQGIAEGTKNPRLIARRIQANTTKVQKPVKVVKVNKKQPYNKTSYEK